MQTAAAIACRPQHAWLPAAGASEQLILLLHGWGQDGSAMLPLADALRASFPQAAVLAPDAPQAVDAADDAGAVNGFAGDMATGTAAAATAAAPNGRQWYSIRDLTPQTWPNRVATALPALRHWVRQQQQRLGVAPAATALGGFSQGAILALSLAALEDGIAGRVLAFGGCFPAPPAAAPRHTTVHLFHGSADRVIPAKGSRDALQWLGALQGDATLDIAEGAGHTLHPALVDCAVQRLQTHIPLRTWQAALGTAPAASGSGRAGAEDAAGAGCQATGDGRRGD